MTDDYQIYLPHVSGGAAPESDPRIDILPFMWGDSATLYELTLIDKYGKQHTARCQTQTDAAMVDGRYHWWFTKSNGQQAEWEEFAADQSADGFIYRGLDTSPGYGEMYELRDIDLPRFSRWCPRRWAVGDVYKRSPLVTVMRKHDCSIVRMGQPVTWLRFAGHYPHFHTPAGDIGEVVELHWLLDDPHQYPDQEPVEIYRYSRRLGALAAWRGERGQSVVEEIHEPGTRPDNVREFVPCLEN
jgi:hypothetical protein